MSEKTEEHICEMDKEELLRMIEEDKRNRESGEAKPRKGSRKDFAVTKKGAIINE